MKSYSAVGCNWTGCKKVPTPPAVPSPGPSIHALSAFPFPSGSTYFHRLVLGFAGSVTLARHLSCSAVVAKRLSLSLCHASCTANRPTRPDGWSSSNKTTAGPARQLPASAVTCHHDILRVITSVADLSPIFPACWVSCPYHSVQNRFTFAPTGSIHCPPRLIVQHFERRNLPFSSDIRGYGNTPSVCP